MGQCCVGPCFFCKSGGPPDMCDTFMGLLWATSAGNGGKSLRDPWEDTCIRPMYKSQRCEINIPYVPKIVRLQILSIKQKNKTITVC